jgi:prepilin-type N-terminal cleavage/methylation domain-containing protein/prepilin-type processing-associated H-X9-DG protein
MHTRRIGFTLVELLVVIAIIGVLIALLLPAVQAARESARLTQCTNHLKQLALAVQNFADAKKTFPRGKTVVSPTSCGAPADYSNWAIEILPFIEEQALYDQYHFEVINGDALNKSVIQKIVPGMICPSDPNNSRVGTPSNGSTTMDFATGSYKGVAGRAYFNPASSFPSADAAFFDNARLPIGTPLKIRDRGPLFTIITNTVSCQLATMHKSPIKTKQITDGTSKTLLIGEYTTISELGRSGFWANSYYGMNLASIALPWDCATNPNCDPSSTSISLDPDFLVCQTGMNNRRDSCSRTFAGLHGGGGAINFALCDGSVQRIATEINMKVLAGMATTSGDEMATN